MSLFNCPPEKNHWSRLRQVRTVQPSVQLATINWGPWPAMSNQPSAFTATMWAVRQVCPSGHVHVRPSVLPCTKRLRKRLRNDRLERKRKTIERKMNENERTKTQKRKSKSKNQKRLKRFKRTIEISMKNCNRQSVQRSCPATSGEDIYTVKAGLSAHCTGPVIFMQKVAIGRGPKRNGRFWAGISGSWQKFWWCAMVVVIPSVA